MIRLPFSFGYSPRLRAAFLLGLTIGRRSGIAAARDVAVKLAQLITERDQRLAEIKDRFEEQVAELRGEMAKTRAAMERLTAIDHAQRTERDLQARLH
jgi:hypothetical protein